MIRILRLLAVSLALGGFCALAETQPETQSQKLAPAPQLPPMTPEEKASIVTTDMLSIPTPGELMAALNKLGKPDWSGEIRQPIGTNFSSRAQMALNLGGLIADGYIAVEAEDAQQIKNIGKDIMAIAKPLGVEQDIVNRGRSLTEFANQGQWESLKEEFEATQNEVKAAMIEKNDQNLVTLVTLGGWIRGTEVISDYIASHYSPTGGKLLRQPAVVEYFTTQIAGLPEKLRDDPSLKKVRMKLPEIQMLVSFPRDGASNLEQVKSLHTITSELMIELLKKGTK